MRTTRSILLLVFLALLALVGAGCGSDDDGGDAKDATPSSTETEGGGGDEGSGEEGSADEPDETFQIQVKDGAVIGGPQSMKASTGDTVRIEILSDAADEAHLHGIDAETKLEQGTPSVMEFEVEAAGSYELELHDSGLVLGSVQVS